ncbi:MAG: M23 family metallopeptidase [Oscillospiraceae bacterium]|nr:M23 family metallopeptidase [Oscillospiraceae bacterium]
MNNSQSEKKRKSLAEKGYYMVLLLCIAAVGITGYSFLANLEPAAPAQQPTLSVPLTPKTPSRSVPSAAWDEPADEPTLVLPVAAGETLTAFSATELGWNDTTRDWRLHDAIDLAAESGDPVCACMAGTVTAVENDDALGWTVSLRHDNGYTTCYASLAEKPLVAVGDAVSAGEVIGAVGETASTELALPSHLHFAVYRGGTAVDPASLFS